LSYDEDPTGFASVQPTNLRGLRIAWSRTLGGLPIEPEVTAVLESAREVLVGCGCTIDDWEPDLDDADRCWEIIEMHEFMAGCLEEAQQHGSRLRAELLENVTIGKQQTAEQIAWAQVERTRIYRRTAAMFARYDFLIAPATPVFAPAAEREWVQQINGQQQQRYFEWQRCASRVTAMAHPAISIPAGFSRHGLPIGMQVIGADRADLGLLNFAAALEAVTGLDQRRPPGL
jgi:amidase